MGKKLIITEKPSVARDFARVLKVSGNKDGYIENNEYVVSWCYGHLVQMVYPEEYDIKYKTWNLEDLPFLPKDYKYGVVESAANQYKVVNHLLHRDDIDTVYWAGDSGKEGQTIEENIRNYGGVRAGMTELRVWIDSQTDDEILRGIKEAKPMSEYARLGASGIMRTIEDYSLGINFSRALSVKYGRLINDAAATTSYSAIAIGRVMTCVLGMVVEREREIRNFNEDPFYKVAGKFSDVNFPAEWKAVEGSKYFESPLLYGDKGNGFKDRANANKLIEDLTNKEASISDKETGISKKKAPLLFNLAELQSECSKRFKISPAQTLNIIQELYEKKYTTYPRTDARVLTMAVAKEISKNLNRLQGYAPTAKFVHEILQDKKYINLEKTSYTDDSKVTDHYAIIPTGQCNGIDRLSALSQKVYDLIVRRFLSIFYPPAEYKNVKLTIQIEQEKFFASAKLLVKEGYLEIAGIPKAKAADNASDEGDSEESEDDYSKEKFAQFVEEANVGDKIIVCGFTIKEGKTSAPKRYTSGSLILAMENAGKLIEDEDLREQIKTTGIGTSATRGEILEKLVRIHYLNQNNKTQVITPENLGEMIYEVVALTTPSLLKPEQTANWEKGLEGIIDGTVEFDNYRSQLENYIRTETQNMIAQDLTQTIALKINQFTGKNSKGIATRKPLGIKCPVCGGEITTTSFGYGCSNYNNEEIKCRFSVGKIAGVDLEEQQFKKLFVEGKTDLIEGFKSKSNQRFNAKLKLKTNDEGKQVIVFDFEGVAREKLEGVKCPDCGGDMLKTPFGYGCSNYNKQEPEKGCRFMIGKVASKQLSKNDCIQLLSEGKTGTIRGFKGKSGKKFDACLVLNKNDEGKTEIGFDFDNVEAKEIKDVVCPVCGGKIVVTSFGYGCSNYNRDNPDKSCRFNIGAIAGVKIKEGQLKALLSNGITDLISGFKSKKGTKFDARLALSKDDEGKVTGVKFVFEDNETELKGVVCPKCGAPIIKNHFGYRCKNNIRDNQDSCSFYLGKVAGVEVEEEQFIKLITDKKTDLISGFLSKKGLFFDARLKLNDEGRTEFEFENYNG